MFVASGDAKVEEPPTSTDEEAGMLHSADSASHVRKHDRSNVRQSLLAPPRQLRCTVRSASCIDPRHPPAAAASNDPGTFWALTGMFPQFIVFDLPRPRSAEQPVTVTSVEVAALGIRRASVALLDDKGGKTTEIVLDFNELRDGDSDQLMRCAIKYDFEGHVSMQKRLEDRVSALETVAAVRLEVCSGLESFASVFSVTVTGRGGGRRTRRADETYGAPDELEMLGRNHLDEGLSREIEGANAGVTVRQVTDNEYEELEAPVFDGTK